MKKSGQTLVEIIVVIGVVIILTTGLVILTTYSVKSTRLGALRGQAVKYAAEGMEIVRQHRDNNWEEFKTLRGIICVGSHGSWQTGLLSCRNNLNDIFSRSVEFTWDEDKQRMEATVSASWTEGENYYETTLESYFTQPQ